MKKMKKMKKIIKIFVLMIFAFSGFSQTTGYIRPAHDCLGSGAPIEAPNPDYGCSTWYDTLNNAEYRFEDGVWVNKTAIDTVNLYNSNGTIPNGSNRTITNSTEGLKIVDQNYSNSYTQFFNDYNNPNNDSGYDVYQGIKISDSEEYGENKVIGWGELGFGIYGLSSQFTFNNSSVDFMFSLSSYAFSQNYDFNGLCSRLYSDNNRAFFEDKLAAKKGLQLKGFGESDYDDTAGTADYSTLVNTSLVPKKYVDDNDVTEINDLSDGFSNGSGVNVGLGLYALNSVTPVGPNGKWNTALGYYSLPDNTTGKYNVAVGSNSLYQNTISGMNTAIGSWSLSSFSYANVVGFNTAVGYAAGRVLIDGTNNIFLGANAAANQINGNYNIAIGYNVDLDDLTGSYQLNIGNIIKGDMTSGSESVKIEGSLYQKALSADPADPPNGYSVRWLSDGTGSGDDGDIMEKITNTAGVTKIRTVVDFSAL